MEHREPPVGDVVQAVQPAAISHSSSSVATPFSIASRANCDTRVRAAQLSTHQARSASLAKHQAVAVAVTSVNPASSTHVRR